MCRADNGRISPNFTKVNLFRKIFCEFFINPFFSIFPKIYHRLFCARCPATILYMASVLIERAGGKRLSLCSRSAPGLPIFFLHMAARSIESDFPKTQACRSVPVIWHMFLLKVNWICHDFFSHGKVSVFSTKVFSSYLLALNEHSKEQGWENKIFFYAAPIGTG